MAFGAEGRARYQRQVMLVDQVFSQFQIGADTFDLLDQAFDIGEGVERAIGLQTADAGDVVQGIDQKIVAFFEGFDHRLHAALVATQGGYCGSLGDGAGIRGALALHGVH